MSFDMKENIQKALNFFLRSAEEYNEVKMGLNKTQLKDIARSLKVTDQQDTRSFLALVYAEAKAIDSTYSYVKMSADLGLGSTNAHNIITGKRPLTSKAAMKICDALGITGVQKKYFLTLVQQERATSVGERDEAFQTRVRLKQKILPNDLDRRQLAFFDQWYHAAILEILRLDGAEDSPEWIASKIRPEISVPKARESLELLVELGYLRKDAKKGRLFPTDATISTGNEVAGLALLSFHRQMLKLALDAVESVGSEERDISAVTVSVSPALQIQMKEEIVAMRKRFLALAAQESEPGVTVQVNFQMFPLTKGKVK